MRFQRVVPRTARLCCGLILCLIMSCLCFGQSLQSSNREKDAPLKLLFIGSSYLGWYDTVGQFETLARTAGKQLTVERRIKYGTNLSYHAESQETIQKINQQKWDYVILQGSGHYISQRKWHPQILPYIRQLKAMILNNFNQTKIVYMMPWGYKDGLEWMPLESDSYEELQRKNHDETVRFIHEENILTAPAGWAWGRVISEEPEMELFETDLSHQSRAGAYLTACVFYVTVFQERMSNIPYLGDVGYENARYFQEMASNVVLEQRDKWNLIPLLNQSLLLMLPHFADEPGIWETCLNVANGSATDESVTLVVYSDEGVLGPSTMITLPGHGGLQSSLTNLLPDMTQSTGWLKFGISSSEICGIVSFHHIPSGGACSFSLLPLGNRKLTFPLVREDETWSSAIAICNTSFFETELIFQIYDYQGVLVASEVMTLPPGGRLIAPLQAVFQQPLPDRSILSVQADEDISGLALAFTRDFFYYLTIPGGGIR